MERLSRAAAAGLADRPLLYAAVGLLVLAVLLAAWAFRSWRALAELRERYRVLFDRNQAGVFRATVEGEILEVNAALAGIYGYDSVEEMRRERAWDLYPKLSDREEYLRRLEAEGTVENHIHHHRTRDGEDLWLLERASLVETKDGERHIVGTLVDVSPRMAEERRREAVEERYRALFEQNVAGAFRSTPGGRILEVNAAFAEMLGHASAEELEGRNARELYASPERRAARVARLEREGRLHNERLALRGAGGEVVWVIENSFLTRDPETGEPVNVGTVTEITDQVRQERELEALAHRDPLTGVPNRRFLEEAVPRALARAGREGDSVGIVYLDLNDFKEINDRWGHDFGDLVLREVARRIRNAVRDADYLGRIGGDEFVVVLAGLEGREDALRASRRLFEAAFGEPVDAGGISFSMTAKLGVAVFPEDGPGFRELLTRADRAMYRAARSGKPIQLYDDLRDRPYEGRLRRIQTFEEALERQEVLGHVQPIYRLDDGRLAGVETLVRWEPEGGELVGASELLRLAEAAGRLAEVDREVLRRAAAYLDAWRGGTVSVNLGPAFFETGEAVATVRELLREVPAAGDHLTLEVTERTIMEEDGTVEQLREIAGMGLRLSLDDFGSGYSSLAVLDRFPVAEVKVDRSLVRDIGTGGGAERLLGGVLDLARAMGAEVVAEGVERRAQLAWLAESGCDRVQGFLLARPAPPEAALPGTIEEALEGGRTEGIRGRPGS